MSNDAGSSDADSNIIVKKWIYALALWLCCWAAVFHQSLLSAVRVWNINESFTHCFLVLPLSLYALWLNKGELFKQELKPAYLPMLAVLGILLIFSLGMAAHVELLQHLAVFSLIPAMFALVFGWKVLWVAFPPLAFILFSVPVGEELVPLFQEITADISIWLLRLIEVPVFRDGLYLTVPNGSFVVAEACSGIRFFISCFVVGCAYAYLNFVSLYRAGAFLCFSLILPIIANGLRAFGIIYIGYSTNMKHAVGADHLVYGWFFFAIVIGLLVLAGYFFSDGQRRLNGTVEVVDSSWSVYWKPSTVALSIMPFVLAIAVLGFINFGSNKSFELEEAGLVEAKAERIEKLSWAPQFKDADRYEIEYTPMRKLSGVYRATYFSNTQGKELIAWGNRLFDNQLWSIKNTHQLYVDNVGGIQVYDLTSLSGKKRLLAYWYVIHGATGSGKMSTKLKQAANTLMAQPSGGAVVAISREYMGDGEAALAKLKTDLVSVAPSLSVVTNPN